MSSFTKRWRREENPNRSRGKGRFNPREPLKQVIAEAERKLQIQIGKLELALAKIADRDSYLLKKAVGALQRKDTEHAAVYANELAEVRKLSKMVTQAELALQQVVLRLNTVRDLGDIATTLSPAVSVIRSVGSSISSIVPEAQGEMGEIGNLLSEIIDGGGLSDTHINIRAADEEADRILAEASALAEERTKQLFPEVPIRQIQKAHQEFEME